VLGDTRPHITFITDRFNPFEGFDNDDSEFDPINFGITISSPDVSARKKIRSKKFSNILKTLLAEKENNKQSATEITKEEISSIQGKILTGSYHLEIF